MIWILISFILFPFLLKAIHNRRTKLEVHLQEIIPGPISRFIYLMSKRLPAEEVATISKPTLCIWNMAVVEMEETICKQVNHHLKMKLAYLSQGKSGLVKYVSQFLNPDQVERFRNEIFKLEV
jgi:hypothetical protein